VRQLKPGLVVTYIIMILDTSTRFSPARHHHGRSVVCHLLVTSQPSWLIESLAAQKRRSQCASRQVRPSKRLADTQILLLYYM
jgi:hypothetical protein